MDVYSILNDIAECGNVSSQHIQQLVACMGAEPTTFTLQLEKAYLKLIKHFSATSKGQRRAFESMTEKIVTHLARRWSEQSGQRTRKQQSSDSSRAVLLHILQLFAEGLDSTQFNTRICCGRYLFMALRGMPPEVLNDVIDERTAFDVLNNTVGLFRNNRFSKTGKTQKGLAVKLGSYLQHISFEDKRAGRLREAIVALKAEMVRTICEEEKRELRLDALTNTELNEATLPFILVRIRDTDPNVRLQVFRKLLKNRHFLNKLQTLDAYQLIYDGLRNSNPLVVEQCETYLIQSFASLLQNDENQPQNQNMQEEKQAPNKRKSLAQVNQSELNRVQKAVQTFLGVLQIDKTLIFPQLYSSILDALKTILKQPHDSMALYLRDLFKRWRDGNVQPSELAMLKVLCQVSQNDRAALPSEYALIVDHNYPEGVHFAQMFDSQQSSLAHIYEHIQLAHLLINTDELGRKELQAQLINLIANYRELKYEKLATAKHNEIYEDVTDQQLENRWFAQHHFELPIVRHYFDLLTPTVKVLKGLLQSPEELVEVVLQVIADLKGKVVNHDQLTQQLSARQQEQTQLKSEIDQLGKKRKQNAEQLRISEELYNKNQAQLQSLAQQLTQATQTNQTIDIHILYLLDSLFNQLDYSKVPDKVFLRLKNLVIQISDQYVDPSHTQSALPKTLSFRTLGYIPLFGLDVGGSTLGTLAAILEAPPSQDDPIIICALRSTLDALLMYDTDHHSTVGAQLYSKQRILNSVLAFAFKSTPALQAIALEGLSKLLLHQKLQKPQLWLALFLLLWFDAALRARQLPLQILTSFFKLYITSSLEFLMIFEKGLEIYMAVACYLHYAKDHILNPTYLHSPHHSEPSLLQAATAGLKMMTYRPAPQHPAIQELTEKFTTQPENFVGPQERLVMFLAKLLAEHNNLVLKPVLAAATKHADFPQYLDPREEAGSQKIPTKPQLYEALVLFLEQAIERLEKANLDVKTEMGFLKVLREDLPITRQDAGHALRDRLNAEFDLTKNDINQLVKDLKKNQLIIPGSKEDKKEAIVGNEEGDSSEEEEAKKKKRKSSDSIEPKVRPKRRR